MAVFSVERPEPSSRALNNGTAVANIALKFPFPEFTKHDLADQIEDAIASGKLPSQITESLDAVRNIGNFAAHPQKSKASGQLLDVEAGEAEWNLETVEALFDFYFVQPKIVADKKTALNTKLAAAGKPAIK